MAANPTAKPYWDRFFFGWFSAESLGYLRTYFGYALCVYFTTQYIQLFTLNPFGPQFHYTIPIWYFELLGIVKHVPWFDWVVFAVLMAACVCFAQGRRTRTAIVVIFLTVAYLKGVRDSFSGDVHHREQPIFALLALFLMSRSGEVAGKDAAANPPKHPVADWEASWPIRGMQIYIAFFYFWALVGKLRISGLYWFEDGGRIQDMLLARSLRDGVDASGNPVNLSAAFDLAQNPDLTFLIGLTVFAFELLAPLILFFRSRGMRILFCLGATAFHLSNYFLMNVQFYFYPFVLMTFFDMKAVHLRLLQMLSNRSAQVIPAPGSS